MTHMTKLSLCILTLCTYHILIFLLNTRGSGLHYSLKSGLRLVLLSYEVDFWMINLRILYDSIQFSSYLIIGTVAKSQIKINGMLSQILYFITIAIVGPTVIFYITAVSINEWCMVFIASHCNCHLVCDLACRTLSNVWDQRLTDTID